LAPFKYRLKLKVDRHPEMGKLSIFNIFAMMSNTPEGCRAHISI